MVNTLEDCCCVACGVVFAVLVAAAFPVTQITLGAVNLHECPAGPAVPIYELVSGVVTLLVMSQAVLWKLVPSGLLGKIWAVWVVCLDLFALVWFLYGSYHIYVIYQPSFTKPTIDPEGLNNSTYGSPEPNLEPSNQTLSPFNHTWDADGNLTATVPPDNWSSEMKDMVMKAPQAAASVTGAAPYCNRTLYLFAFWTTTLVYGFAALGLVIAACFYSCMLLIALLTSSVR